MKRTLERISICDLEGLSEAWEDVKTTLPGWHRAIAVAMIEPPTQLAAELAFEFDIWSDDAEEIQYETYAKIIQQYQSLNRQHKRPNRQPDVRHSHPATSEADKLREKGKTIAGKPVRTVADASPQRKFLSATEEKNLLRRAKEGDTAAKDKIVLAFRPMAERWAYKFASKEYGEARDLTQELIAAIADAIDSYDTQREERFATHAIWQMKGVLTKIRRANEQSVTTENPSVPVWEAELAWLFDDSDSGDDRSAVPQMVERGGKKVVLRPEENAVAADYWPDRVRNYVGSLRGNSREIAMGLWFEGTTAAELSRRLGVSRPAISKQKKKLQKELTGKFGNLFFGQ